MRELIDEYCEGMQDGHEFYGYFPGGASGGILPASLGDEPLDFDTLQKHGCFIGSAAIVVLSDKDSAKAMALNSMRFFEDESCGQCVPCRVGTMRQEESLLRMASGSAREADVLADLALVMADSSICGFGHAASWAVQSALQRGLIGVSL